MGSVWDAGIRDSDVRVCDDYDRGIHLCAVLRSEEGEEIFHLGLVKEMTGVGKIIRRLAHGLRR